jgi:hypothetical protein
MNDHLASIMTQDRWSILEKTSGDAPALLRYRSPVPKPTEVEGCGWALRILWAYAEVDSGAWPTPDDSEKMSAFEEKLSQALEGSMLAFLAAVLTFDGARTWLFYTRDVDECSRRLNATFGTEPLPIELDAFEDPQWEHLRADVGWASS